MTTSTGLPFRGHSALRARRVAVADLTPADLGAWLALEERAIEPNAYHSPCFVVPALQHLDAGAKAQVILIERAGPTATELVGVAVVRPRLRSPVLALPHAEVYLSRHSFLGVPLLDRHSCAEAWRCLLQVVGRALPACAGLLIRHIDAQGALLRSLQEVQDAAVLPLGRIATLQRAMLIPGWAGPDSLKASLRGKFAEVERCRRRLGETGQLTWAMHRDATLDPQIDTFLRLEHQGWKREEGSSLLSQADDEAFFRAMSHRFAAAGRALFTELSLNGVAVASTCNYVSGGVGFAFKVGWDEQYRKFGVGILNEAELVRHAPQACADLRYIDSGAAQDSFIERLWPQRRQLVTVFAPTSRWGAVAWQVQERARALRPARMVPQPATSTHMNSIPA